MNIMHRISFNSNRHDILNYFEKMGLKISSGIIAVFVIGENDKRWDDVRTYIDNCPSDIIDLQLETQFTKSEIDSASCFALSPNWHNEYPQPVDDFGYQAIIYDTNKICNKCGVEPVQITSFSVRKNPRWGKRNIVQLNWIFDEYFVSGILKSQLENKRPKLNFKAVNKYRTENELDNIFQLDIDQNVALDMSSVKSFDICSICKQKKYLPHTKGYFPCPISNNFTIAHSTQCFGSGHKAFHAVLISKDVYNLFREIGVNGVSYIPCFSRRVECPAPNLRRKDRHNEVK